MRYYSQAKHNKRNEKPVYKMQANNSLYNNRKIIPEKTGYGTIRQIKNGKYVIVVWFNHWKKSHAVDCHSGIPHKKGREYHTFTDAVSAMKRYMPNVLRHRHLPVPIAMSDKYHNQVCVTE